MDTPWLKSYKNYCLDEESTLIPSHQQKRKRLYSIWIDDNIIYKEGVYTPARQIHEAFKRDCAIDKKDCAREIKTVS